MIDGPLLTHWTIRVALACLALRLGGELLATDRARWFAWSRWIWTIGCIAFLAHIYCAFAYYHHFRHTEALEVTARRTQEMMGVRFGEGIYFSYLFAMIWLADVAWQWLLPVSYQHRSGTLSTGILAYMAFIAFNGAVIFEGGMTRWVGIPVSLVLGALLLVALVRKQKTARAPSPSTPQATP